MVLSNTRRGRVIETHRVLRLMMLMRQLLLLMLLVVTGPWSNHWLRSGATLRRIARYCCRVATEPEREAERLAHYPSESASECDVDDEVDRRVDYHQ